MMETLQDTLIEFEKYIKANIQTCLIAKITKVNNNTINCLPVISREFKGQKVDLREFTEVPLMLLAGGGSSIQMPIATGDYCILLVNERCFDAWYVGQDFILPTSRRTHDYSDSICIGIIKNKASELSIPTTTTITGDVVHVGNLNITGNLIVDGEITATGIIKSDIDVVADTISLKNHTHSGGYNNNPTGTPI